jgi:hypothetical protein
MSKAATLDLSIAAPLSPALSLRQACRKTGYDDSGGRCPGCSLKELCENEERWIVRLIDQSHLA